MATRSLREALQGIEQLLGWQLELVRAALRELETGGPGRGSTPARSPGAPSGPAAVARRPSARRQSRTSSPPGETGANRGDSPSPAGPPFS